MTCVCGGEVGQTGHLLHHYRVQIEKIQRFDHRYGAKTTWRYRHDKLVQCTWHDLCLEALNAYGERLKELQG